jgi:hypothetical protein
MNLYNNFLTQCLISEMIVPDIVTRTEELVPSGAAAGKFKNPFFHGEA